MSEDAVLVAKPVAHGRELHRGHRVQEARRKPAEPAVAQACVGFFLQHAEPVQVLLLDDSLHGGIEEEVHDVVCQGPPDEELHGEVVDALGVRALISALRAQPPLRKDIPHRAGDGLEPRSRIHGSGINDVVEHEMPLVQRFGRPREPDWPALIPLDELVQLGRPRRSGAGRPAVAAHGISLLVSR